MNKLNRYLRTYEQVEKFSIEASVPRARIVKRGNGWAVSDTVPHLGGSIKSRRPSGRRRRLGMHLPEGPPTKGEIRPAPQAASVGWPQPQSLIPLSSATLKDMSIKLHEPVPQGDRVQGMNG